MDLNLIYRAVASGEIDVTAGDATSGLIDALGLVVLEDDRHYFPVYDAVPVARASLLLQHPEVAEALRQLEGRISAVEMQRMNYAVDGEKRDPAEVARAFLDTIDKVVCPASIASRPARHFPSAPTRVSFYSLPALAQRFPGVATLPYSLKILLENLLRREDDGFVKQADIEALASWSPKTIGEKEISFMPARVLLQDFTGVPCVVDLAAMRDGIVALGGDPHKVNPLQPVELVIDHSVQVDHFGTSSALALNADLEYYRNRERYVFLRWGQTGFRNFRVVPPETGIVHQVNIEYLARVVCREVTDQGAIAYPDTVFGTDSHTTMVNGLGVVGWGVGGIEAEAAMLGQPSSMLIPPVLGYRLSGTVAGRRHRHRPRADDHRSAAQERRGRQVRRVLRTGSRAPDHCRSRHARQHVSRIRRHRRDLPDRRHDARIPEADRPRRAADRAGRSLRPRARDLPNR